jgi:hypothetical protein
MWCGWRDDLCRLALVMCAVARASAAEAADAGAGEVTRVSAPIAAPAVPGRTALPASPDVPSSPDPAVPAAAQGAREPAPRKPAVQAKPPSLLAPLPSPPVAPAETYELRRADDGSGDLLYRAPGFDARIHPDGSVRFIDRHIGLTFFPFLPYRTKARGPTIESLLRGALLGKTRAQGSPTGPAVNPEEQPASLAPRITPYRPDPNEGCRYPAPCFFESRVFVIVAGTFDITDEMMRVFGQDPYRYEKARFMKGTEAMRVGFAARAHADDLRRASAQLRPRLEEIAADDQRTMAERRAIIEALASEMDVTTAAGKQARAVIEDFLRTHFGSREATRPVEAAPNVPQSRSAVPDRR